MHFCIIVVVCFHRMQLKETQIHLDSLMKLTYSYNSANKHIPLFKRFICRTRITIVFNLALPRLSTVVEKCNL